MRNASNLIFMIIRLIRTLIKLKNVDIFLDNVEEVFADV